MTTPNRNEAVAPVAWMTEESMYRLKGGGNNSRGTVPVHCRESAVTKYPLYPQSVVDALQGEVSRLRAIIDTPQANDFLRAVSTESEHQRQRWGSDHDAGKTPADWFWLVGYLAGKALHAHAAGNFEKAEHHIITTAAALANWHLSMFGGTDMRPGIDGEAALNLEPPTDGR